MLAHTNSSAHSKLTAVHDKRVSKMDMDFEKLFFFNIMAMRVTYCHPDVARDKRWLLRFSVLHGLFTALTGLMIYNICFVYLKTKNFSRLCTNGLYVGLYLEISAQYIIMLYYQDTLNKMISIMKSDYVASKMSDDEYKIVLKWATKGKRITVQWFALVSCACGGYAMKTIILTIYYALTDEFRFVKILDVDYPDIVERNMDNVFVYVFIILLSQVHGSLYTSAVYLAFVPLGPIFMLHACGQLELVRHRIATLYDGSPREDVKKRLKRIAKQMQSIYTFTDDINSCFQVIYEVTIKGSAIIIPLTTYEVVQAAHRGVMSIELVTFIIASIAISSTPCCCSDILMDESEKVRMALYMCGWERDFDRSVRSSLLIMLTRARRPTAVRTMFRTVCLEALTDLFHQAYAIYNLMNAMWN